MIACSYEEQLKAPTKVTAAVAAVVDSAVGVAVEVEDEAGGAMGADPMGEVATVPAAVASATVESGDNIAPIQFAFGQPNTPQQNRLQRHEHCVYSTY